MNRTIPNVAELRVELKRATTEAWQQIWDGHRQEEIYGFGIDSNGAQHFLPWAVSEQWLRSVDSSYPYSRWDYAASPLNELIHPLFDRTNALLEASWYAAEALWEQETLELEEQGDFSSFVAEPDEWFRPQAYDVATEVLSELREEGLFKQLPDLVLHLWHREAEPGTEELARRCNPPVVVERFLQELDPHMLRQPTAPASAQKPPWLSGDWTVEIGSNPAERLAQRAVTGTASVGTCEGAAGERVMVAAMTELGPATVVAIVSEPPVFDRPPGFDQPAGPTVVTYVWSNGQYRGAGANNNDATFDALAQRPPGRAAVRPHGASVSDASDPEGRSIEMLLQCTAGVANVSANGVEFPISEAGWVLPIVPIPADFNPGALVSDPTGHPSLLSLRDRDGNPVTEVW